MSEAVALGELLIDFVSLDRDRPLAALPRFVGAAGGAPANVAVGLQRLGIPAGFIGAVGEDPFGEHLRRTLAAEQVDVSHLRTCPDVRTTLAFIATRRDGRKDIAFYRNPGADARLSPEQVPDEYLRGARLFHFGSVSLSQSPARETTQWAARHARELGLLVSYDPNWRPTLWEDHAEAARLIWQMMAVAEVVHCAEEEWGFVTGESDLRAGAERILAQGPKLVVVTCGARGCSYFTAQTSGAVPGFAVEVVDPTGAGDAFVAALLARLLRSGRPLAEVSETEWRDVMAYANAAGALTCTRPGVIPSLPTAEEVAAFLRARTA